MIIAPHRAFPADLAALAGLLVAASACEIGPKNILAPTNATLTLSSPVEFIPINQGTTLRVTLLKQDGTPVQDGTEVVLTATLGQFDQRKVRTEGGAASAKYQAGGQVGVDQIEAASGSLKSQISLAIGSAAVSRIQLLAEPLTLPPSGGEAALAALAISPTGVGVVGVPVRFETSAGSITPSDPVLTDGDGVARASLKTNTPATVRAQALNFRSDEIAIRLRSPVDLIITPSTPTADIGQSVVFNVTAMAGGQPVVGGLRVEFGDGQSADLGQIAGTATTSHAYNRDGGFNVTARFFEPGGQEVRSTIRMDVRAGGGPGPVPGPPTGVTSGDQIDPKSIRWLSPASTDVSDWRITSTVTSVDIRGDDICINHTKAGQWPLVSIDGNPPNIEGNPMIVVNIGGQWYGAGFDWFGQGRTCKHMPAVEYGRDQIRVHPLDASWPGPRSGDLIGLLVSTPSSDRIPVRSVNERSNIVLIRWP
ncbi:MAG TPA: hypothetical protein VLD67_09860 [Vicinamibacterales bacterium]|nr:hypothetical protein [Vicinamibacterales bacterium]